MKTPLHARIFAALLTPILVIGISTPTQATTLKKIVILKAGRTAAPVINTLLNGKGAPKSTLGINGDFYIDIASMNIYGPKAKGKWPAAVSLKGPSGTNGINGTNGSTGPSGAKGTATNGLDGKNGTDGTSGSGSSGAMGAQGPAGPAGATGAQGSGGQAGNAGPAGSNGAKGDTGSQGPIGNPGTIGNTGPQGDAGIKGDPGNKGDAGIKGDPGNKGETGTVGDTGPRGDVGAKGDAGLQGVPGNKGETGTVGDTGPAGAAISSKATFGVLTFTALIGLQPTAAIKEFGNFSGGKNYVLQVLIHGVSGSDGTFKSIKFAIGSTNSNVILSSDYVVLNGFTNRSGSYEQESSILATVLVNGLNSGIDYSLTITVTCNANLSSPGLLFSGSFNATQIGTIF